MKVGVQVSVPEVLPAPGVNTALCRAGRPERSAVSEVIAWPSGSAAVTLTVSWCCSPTPAVAGAVTTGGRSTVIAVVADRVRPPETAVKVTL